MQHSIFIIQCCILAILLLTIPAPAAAAGLLDFAAFHRNADSVTVNTANSATLAESPDKRAVWLSSDPGLGEPGIIFPERAEALVIDYSFVEPPGNDDAFYAWLIDPETHQPLVDANGQALAFLTRESSSGAIVWSLAGASFLGRTVGIEFQLFSNLGETATGSMVTVVVRDTVPPTIAATVSPPANSSGWHNGPVSITFSCGDEGLGVATCPDPTTINSEGAGQSVTATATDAAGNRTDITVTVSIDRTAPQVIAPAPLTINATTPQGIALDSTEIAAFLAAATTADNLDPAPEILPPLLDGTGIVDALPIAVGIHEVTFQTLDWAGNTGAATARLIVVNPPPSARSDLFNIDEDTVLTVTGPGVLANDTDPNGDPLTAQGLTLPGHGQLDLAPDGGFIYRPDADWSGEDSFTYRTSDGTGISGAVTVTITVHPIDDPASITVLAPTELPDGDILAGTVSFTDPDSSAWTLVIDYGDGSLAETRTLLTREATFSHAFPGPGTYTLTVTVTSEGGAAATRGHAVTVSPAGPPVITGFSATLAPTPVGGTITATISAHQPGAGENLTAALTWGDGVTTPANLTHQGSGLWTATSGHVYNQSGIYTLGLAVTGAGGSATANFQYVVIYNPSGGFVTGGGWINSPYGAYAANPELTGKASFGFVSKYQKGATVPTGNTQFQFKAGAFNFQSTRYEWLVISGPQAKYKGEGAINGSGAYGFLLTGIDVDVSCGGGVDKFRIKIWDKTSGSVIYDNQMGVSNDSGAATAIGGGSIQIHK